MLATVERSVCLTCGSGSHQLYPALSDDLYNAPGTWTVVRCSNPVCRLVWLDPAPHPDSLIELYKDYFTHGGEADWRGWKSRLRSAHQATEDCLLAPFGIAAERRRAKAMFLTGDPPATLLDVGCGDGALLKTMSDRGWTVTGIDFDAAAVAGIRERLGLEAHVGTALSMVASGRKFDVVAASHVIEHVSDPVRFLADCAQLLKRGGRVIVRTPNADSIGHSLFGRSWRGLEPPRHLFVFTRPSLIACGGKAGLKAESCVTTDANAGPILAISHFLRRYGRYRLDWLSKLQILKWMVISPAYALRARLSMWRDDASGEELHAIFRAP
jgi:SAM-dependent methyltransferase